MDAVPGRLNQVSLLANRPGTFYGQCSEICGINHAFMPIKVEVSSTEDYLEQYNAVSEALLCGILWASFSHIQTRKQKYTKAAAAAYAARLRMSRTRVASVDSLTQSSMSLELYLVLYTMAFLGLARHI